MEQVLDRAQLGVPPGQRGLQPVDPLRAAHRGQHPDRPPQPLRLGLALQGVLPGVGERDRAARQPLGRHVDQHRPRLGGRLHPGCGVHRVARHHPLADRTQVHRHLAGHHPGARGQAGQPRLGPQLGDRGHQVQRGPHGPLRVPFGRHRGAPDGHHRVPDELLDHPAVPADHRPGDPEVLRQQLADRLRIPGLGQRGEPDDVAEQHRAHPPFGGRPRDQRGNRRGSGATASKRVAPHRRQKRLPGVSGSPQVGQPALAGAPQSPQKRSPSSNGAPHRPHPTRLSHARHVNPVKLACKGHCRFAGHRCEVPRDRLNSAGCTQHAPFGIKSSGAGGSGAAHGHPSRWGLPAVMEGRS